jgi:AcrR family transcriptional regulator
MAAIPNRPALRERYERRQQEVIEVSARVFADRGYQATSMVDLSEATGLTSGGLYHYIGSKEKLLFRILVELMEPWLEKALEIEKREDLSPRERFRMLLREWIAYIERYHHHMIVFGQERHVIEHDSRWDEVRQSRDKFEELLWRMVDEVAPPAKKGKRDDARRLQMLALLGMVNYTPQWYRPEGRFNATQIADAYCDTFFAALGVADED